MIRRISFLRANRLYRKYGPDFILKLQEQHGNLFYIYVPLLPRLFFMLEASDGYDLLVNQRPMLEKPALMRRLLQSSFGNGLFTSQGDVWRKQRKLMQPAFHHALVGQYAKTIVQHTEAMLATWQDGQVIAIDKDMHALTFTIVLDALFSANASANIDVIQQAMQDLSQGLEKQNQSLPLMLLPDWFPLPTLRRKQRGAQILDRLVSQMIAERRVLGEAGSPSDLLSTLLFAHDEKTGEAMSEKQVRDELVTLYIAGHETTAVLLNWTWVLLSQYPDVAAELQSELQTVLKGQSPTISDLPQLTFTNAVIKEVLRLYPAAWLIARETEEQITIRNESIPARSALIFFPYAVHRDERWFEDPLTFRPARWLDNLERSLPKGAYFPFGLGPRICIGNGFAEMEAQLILATIAQRFQLEQLTEAKTKASITLSFAAPVDMKLHKI